MSEMLSLFVLAEQDSPLPETGTIIPHTILEMGQDYSTIGQVVDLSWMRKEIAGLPPRLDVPASPSVETRPLPGDVAVYVESEDGSEYTRTDATGEEMRWALASDLAELEVPVDSDRPVDVRNRAVKAYLGAISGDNAVVLYRR